MARAPRKPREIKRATDQGVETVASPPIIRRLYPRQPDLFAAHFIEPCRPKLATKVPVGPLWQFQIKQDGYRVQCHVLDGQVRIYTKNGHDWTERFPGIVASVQDLPTRSAVIDGEAMIEGEGFVSDFWALHQAAMRRHAPDAFLYAFDLPHIDGEDLRPLPLSERQVRLERLPSHTGPGRHRPGATSRR
jgi:bifunctional non-homologous end joining protein LigD